MKIISKIIILFLFVSTVNLFALDLPGSKDPVGIKRYEGSEIIRYENIAFDSYIVPLGKMTKFDFGTKVAEFEKSETIEGEVTRVSYRVPDPTRSSLEILRNYENSFKADGWEISWVASGKAQFGNPFSHLYESLKDNDQLFTYSDSQAHFLVAKKSDQGLTATLFVTKYDYGLTRGIKINKGDPILHLDVIQTKSMDSKMVVVTSSEMAKSIEQNGRVSLYGIFFDTNKSDIKPESSETLNEIAKLMKENPNLKLLVVGHTDSIGDFEMNRQLSDRRALSVISVLSDKFGIEKSRLHPFGASYSSPLASNATEDGRAKNRRVELVNSAN